MKQSNVFWVCDQNSFCILENDPERYQDFLGNIPLKIVVNNPKIKMGIGIGIEIGIEKN